MGLKLLKKKEKSTQMNKRLHQDSIEPHECDVPPLTLIYAPEARMDVHIILPGWERTRSRRVNVEMLLYRSKASGSICCKSLRSIQSAFFFPRIMYLRVPPSLVVIISSSMILSTYSFMLGKISEWRKCDSQKHARVQAQRLVDYLG